MSAGDQGRPSIPHAMHRVPTGPRATVGAQEKKSITIPLDDIPEDAFAAAAAMGITIETWLRLFRIGARVAVAETRQDDKLRVGLDQGRLDERLDSIAASTMAKRNKREQATLGAAIGGIVSTVILLAWSWIKPVAYEAAKVDAIEPAVRAEQKASALEDRVQMNSERIAEIDGSIKSLVESVSTLNGAVVNLTSKLDQRSEMSDEQVPASTAKPRRGR